MKNRWATFCLDWNQKIQTHLCPNGWLVGWLVGLLCQFPTMLHQIRPEEKKYIAVINLLERPKDGQVHKKWGHTFQSPNTLVFMVLTDTFYFLLLLALVRFSWTNMPCTETKKKNCLHMSCKSCERLPVWDRVCLMTVIKAGGLERHWAHVFTSGCLGLVATVTSSSTPTGLSVWVCKQGSAISAWAAERLCQSL